MSNINEQAAEGGNSSDVRGQGSGSYWCEFKPNVTKLSYTWRIKNFSSFWWCEDIKKNSQLDSSPFPSDVEAAQKWCLRLQLHNNERTLKENFGLFLIPLLGEKVVLSWKCQTSFKMSILNGHRQHINESTVDNHCFTVMGKGYGWPTYISREYVLNKQNKVLHNGTLIICCELELFDGSTKASGAASFAPAVFSDPTLSKDYAEFLDSGRLSDVRLVVNGQMFKAHKMILSARSSVFAAMFQHDMKESAENQVEITDMDGETVTEMLRFIYTGKVKKMTTLAAELLSAADKYALTGLKDNCERYLISKMTTGTAANLLALADMHSAEKLKKEAIQFVSKNAKDVMETEGWGSILKQPELCDAIFKSAFKE